MVTRKITGFIDNENRPVDIEDLMKARPAFTGIRFHD